ncbi:INO80 complex subunit D-like isoform X2 [Thrips palmi]|uniref:INO80 complex subunit D-like isoform X2 n=1 Tax=Thrips palmi TaxID=161013 RepID=A0A6P8YBH7_THRPL|nr:INO80 complex subunit D-like isoform X2 [Thrips palmi]
MFSPSVGANARVNGHVPGLAGGQDSRSDQRKRKGKAPSATNLANTRQLTGSPVIAHQLPDSPRSNSCNGQSKFADRLKGLRGLLQSNGDEAYQNRTDHSDLSELEDPYAFNEPEPVRKYSNSTPAVKVAAKPSGRSVVKSKPDRGSNSTEPTGLNMTRLYPAFFDPSSPQLPSSTNSGNSSKTTLASLLESSAADDFHPKRNELDRSFASFSAKELNCFPNLTSPPPPEQPSLSVVTNAKVSPVKHGMPTTPQRESNKLAALFSPTYLNSLRNDKAKIRKISAPRNQTRDKVTPRVTPCDKRAPKDVVIKSATIPTVDHRKPEDASKTTLSRLQDKIARKMVIGKHQRKMAGKTSNDVPPRRHSVNDVPVKKERSLLEEQLLGHKPIKPLKREETVGVLPQSSILTPPPTATTRVPGVNGPLTYGVSKSMPTAQRINGTPSSKQQKPHATYGGQKPSKTPSINASHGSKSNSLLRHGANGSLTSVTRGKGEISRPNKRPRIKLDVAGDSLKHESLQRLHPSKESKYDIFSRTKVVESDSDDSDLEEGLVYQKHWFSGWMEAGSGLASEDKREGRLLQIRNEFRRKLSQVWGTRRDPGTLPLPKCVINAASTKPSQTALLLSHNQRWHRTGRSKLSMLVPKRCVFGKQGEGEPCTSMALPCAHHCVRHITYNVEQLLFEHCTAKFSDNTQCCVPVFDSSHELPLCSEHARKLDDYNRQSQVLKPKRVRKKSKPPAMTRSTKRNKKKKQKPSPSSQPSPLPSSPLVPDVLPPAQAPARIQRSQSLPVDSLSRPDSDDGLDGSLGLEPSTSPEDSTEIYVTDESFAGLSESQLNVQQINGGTETIVDVGGVDVEVDEALELAGELPELTDAGDLGQQEELLEGHDLTNVLNEIPSIAFTDLFGEDKSREPTREETEELERALAAVDKDVKSLQNMGSQILLDYKAQDLLQTNTGQAQAQAQVFLEVDKLSTSPGLLDIDKLQAQGLFDEKNAQGLLDNFLDDQTLVQTLTQMPADMPGSSTGLVYYHNGYATINGGGMDKNLCAAPSSAASMYQTPNMVGVHLAPQTDLHS